MARILFVLCVGVHLCLGGGTTMRTIKFQDVLWGVAYKFSLDPEQSNFLTNQAIPIGTYIDEWVRRLYNSRDWPEWTITEPFAPVNHVVSYDAGTVGILTSAAARKMGRVIKVFLVDPATTDAPIDTPFTLTDRGVHCGYGHGTNVWIRYIPVPPKFTAVQWNAGTTYQKDDVAYSYTTGEVYRSKANNNVGHDPSSNFSVPPVPILQGNPPPPAPSVDITQQWTPDNPGIAERNKILEIHLTGAAPEDPPDPPTLNSTWEITVTDNTGSPITGGAVSHVATGAETLSDIVTDLYNQFVAGLPGGWTVTKDNTALTITLENASDFRTYGFPATQARWYPPEGAPISQLAVKELQSYIPALSAAVGSPQIAQITIDETTTYPGSTYELSVTGSDGLAHVVEYESQLYDSSAQILQGLILAVEASTDEFWDTVQLSFDPDGITLDVLVNDRADVTPSITVSSSAWWELVPFPKVLADAVMRGATADLMREWGQEDKATAEEGVVPQETAIAETNFTTMPTPQLTGQQAALSRYRIQ